MKLPAPFIQLPLRFDADALAAEIAALDADLWRPHPSGLPGNTALPLVAVDGDAARGDALSGPMRPTPALDRCGYLRRALASLEAVLGRVRLMRLAPGAEVNAHVDTNHYWNERVRVHIPITTHPGVRFFCGDAQTHMAAGDCWIFDTWRLHRVVNDADSPRVHLVVDTVGSAAFGKLVNSGRSHEGGSEGWEPRFVPAGGTVSNGELLFESVNLMSPMTFWELREHVSFLLAETADHPLKPVISHLANEFMLDWRTLWYRYGADPAGAGEFRKLLDAFLARMQRLASEIPMRNRTILASAINGLLGQAIRRDDVPSATEEATRSPRIAAGASAVPPAPAMDYPFDRPVFIVSPPRSGSSLLFETLARSPSVCTIGGESHGMIEGNTAFGKLGAAARGYSSNRLDAGDAEPGVVTALRDRFHARAFDRDGKKPSGRMRLLEKTPKNALRIPFFAEAFPDGIFLYLYRDPREVLASMLEAWESGRFRTYPQLPGWTGLPWSLLLIPGWRDLVGKPLPQIVAAQWDTTTRILLDDLEALPRRRWCIARYDALLSDPDAEIARLCAAVGYQWDQPPGQALPWSVHTLTAPRQGKWRAREREIDAVFPRIADTVARLQRFVDG
jgi:Sulfotransferase family/Aspartyl/Asparaginyl beta-hydroxylase